MKSYLIHFVLVSYVSCLQFEDDLNVNLEQQQQQQHQQQARQSGGFFPSNEEPDDGRFSQISGIRNIDPQDEAQTLNNRKQLSFNENSNHFSQLPPSAGNQFYQTNPYRPVQAINSPASVTVVRKRPSKVPYQYSTQPSNQYMSYPSDLSNPFYQNYANHYQHQYPTATASQYPDYYNPTRFPSPANSANLNSQQQPILHQPSLQYPNYYTNNYANQFGYQRPSSSSNYGGGISNFFNNFRDSANGQLGQFSQVGGQFSKALEDISANDDLQCVPKVLCQMVRSQRRPNALPSFMNVPGISAIISALPSSSPLMNFGRAALLGLSGAADCDSAYPRCPRDEEQMLLYLNNHRGGFFRFFNGGNSFGDDNYLQLQQQHQQESNQQFNQQSGAADQGLNLLAFQALADSLNQGNGINLSNLFSSPSNQRPTVQNYQSLPPPRPPPQQSQGIAGLFEGMFKPNMFTDIVSNLLTGVVGNRFSRRLSKRSLSDENDNEGRHKIEKRIVNLKGNNNDDVQAEQNFFESSSTEQQQQNTLYSLEDQFTFPNGNRANNVQQSQTVLALKFPKEENVQLTQFNQGNSISPSDVAQRLKMIFPEATGHLRFDNDQFNRELLKALVNDRIGKILTGVQQQQQQRPINNNYDNTRYQGTQSYNYNQRPNYAGIVGSSNYNNFNTNHINRGQQNSGSGDRSKIVYITNSQGQIEYTLNESTGEKKRY